MDLEQEISKVAYELFVKSGYIAGREIDNWLEAERIVMMRYKADNPVESEVAEDSSKPKKVAATATKTAKKTTSKPAQKKVEPKKATKQASPKK